MRSQSNADDLLMPALPARLVGRPSVDEILDTAVTDKVTLVVAGPGWGKTTSVGTWAARHGACWVSLEAADESVERISSRMLGTLRRRLPGLPAELVTTSAYGEGHDGAARVSAIAALTCDLLATLLHSELVLVMDDLHKLPPDSDGVRLVEALCRASPPRLRVVLLSRHEPAFVDDLPFGTVRLGSRELAFTAAELASLIGRRPDADAGGETAAQGLLERTAGWPAAVMLHLDALRSGHRTRTDPLGPPGSRMLAGLAREVIAGEPQQTRALLRTIAALDRVSTSLCVALGYPDAGHRLRELAHRGLLATENGIEPSWTVPEPIRELLVGAPSDTTPLRRAAAGLCEELGAHSEALRHLVAAELWDHVAALLLRRDEQIIAAGDVSAVLAATARLPATEGRDLRLFLVSGYAKQQRGDWPGALACYRNAMGPGSVRPCLAWRAGQLYDLIGRPTEALELFARTDFSTAQPLDEIRLLSLAVRWYRECGDLEEANRLAERASVTARRDGGQATQAWSHRASALLAAYAGDWILSEMHYGLAIEHARRAGNRVLELTIRTERARFLADETGPAEALGEIDDVMRLARQSGLTGHEPVCLTIRARANAKLGRYAEGLADADRGQELCSGAGPSRDVMYRLIVQADVHRRRGEPGHGQAFADRAVQGMPGGEPSHPLHVAALAVLARIRAADDLAAARGLAERAGAASVRLRAGQVQATLAMGWIALLSGDQDAARSHGVAARELAGRRGDLDGLADALQLMALSSADPKPALRLLEESGDLLRRFGDLAGAAGAALAIARLRGHHVASAEQELARCGVRCDAAIADVLGAGMPKPPRLVVRTQGSLQVLRDGVPVPTADWQSKKARDLVKILIAHRGRPVPRTRLIRLLWPDSISDRGSNRLSVLLSTLRTVLTVAGHAAVEPIVADRNTVSLDVSVVDVDVERFLEAARQAEAAHRRGDPQALPMLAEAEELHEGEFFAEDEYEEWAMPVRDEVRNAYTCVLRILAKHVPDADQRVRYLQRLIDQEPYDEGTHLELVRLLRAAGRYGEAQRQYETYAGRMLEIGVDPVPAE